MGLGIKNLLKKNSPKKKKNPLLFTIIFINNLNYISYLKWNHLIIKRRSIILIIIGLVLLYAL